MPRASSRQPMDAAAKPLPSEDTTPPVTKMYFADISASEYLVVLIGRACGARLSIAGIPDWSNGVFSAGKMANPHRRRDGRLEVGGIDLVNLTAAGAVGSQQQVSGKRKPLRIVYPGNIFYAFHLRRVADVELVNCSL